MAQKSNIALAALALLLAAGAFLIVSAALKGRGQTPRESPGVVAIIKIELWTPKKTIRETMTLACRNGKPIGATRGFNLEIPSQAKKACKKIVELPAGDYSCRSLATNYKAIGKGEIEGVVNGRKFKAAFEESVDPACLKNNRLWQQFEDLWSIKEKPSPEDAIQAREQLRKSRERNKELTRKLKEERRKAEQKIRQYDKQNQQFIAPK